MISVFSILVFLVSTKRRAKLIAEFTVITSRGNMLGLNMVIDIVVLAVIPAHSTGPAMTRLSHQPSYLGILK